MKILMKACAMVLAVGTAVAIPMTSTQAQSSQSTSQRGQPKTVFATVDLARLRWLEGTWAGTATDEPPVFQRVHFSSDSTIDVTYYADSPTGRESGTSRIYLSVGRVYHTLGPGRWGATRVDSAGVYFIPQANAHNTLSWAFESTDEWTATTRSAVGGRERVTIYHMKRVR